VIDPRVLLWIEAANRLVLEEEAEKPSPEQPVSNEDDDTE